MRPGPGLVVMALAFISGARRGTTTQVTSTSIQGGKLGHSSGDYYPGVLSRVNPWLSACDLEEPKNAPDLQGQCSASTLPVAWVDEGPGPPRCPESCKMKSNNNNYNKIREINNLKNNNKNKNDMEKLKEQQENNNYNNFNNNNNNNNINNKYNNDNEKQHQQQCLYYLGENEHTSPTYICNSTKRADIELKLTNLNLKHCCEHNVKHALDQTTYQNVLNGGAKCIETLNYLLEVDTLSEHVACKFTEILVRYDCRQPYSLIHHCEDCKVAYRRWVCSTLIPYYIVPKDLYRPEDIESNNLNNRTVKSTNNNNNNNSSYSNTTYLSNYNNLRSSSNVNGFDSGTLFTNILKRTRRKSQHTASSNTKKKTSSDEKRRRIRPCLSICQSVEQKCPYFLPADRAPALPTQYAGEPTFLCLDPNIEETEDQIRRSNHGPDECCYKYCELYNGICAICNINLTYYNNNNTNTSDILLSDNDELIEIQCQNPSPNSTVSQNPCIIPYFAASISSASSTTILLSSTLLKSTSGAIYNLKILLLLLLLLYYNYYYKYYYYLMAWIKFILYRIIIYFNCVAAWTKKKFQLAGS